MQEKSLGEWIAEKRRERQWTQAALAAHFGISDKAVSKWERNLSRPEGNHLARLVELLDLPREYLPCAEGVSTEEEEREYLPPQVTRPLRDLPRKAYIRRLSLREVIAVASTAVLLALSVSTSTGFTSVEMSVPIMGICNALLTWGMLWGGK